MKMFFSYLLYAHIRLQIRFGAYKTGRMFLSNDALDTWMLVKAHMMLGLLRFFWICTAIGLFTELTGNTTLTKGAGFLIVSLGVVFVTHPFTTEKAINYEFYKKIFSAWPDSKRRQWDRFVITCSLVSFALFIFSLAIFANEPTHQP